MKDGQADPLKDSFLVLTCSVLDGRLHTADTKRLACRGLGTPHVSCMFMHFQCIFMLSRAFLCF